MGLETNGYQPTEDEQASIDYHLNDRRDIGWKGRASAERERWRNEFADLTPDQINMVAKLSENKEKKENGEFTVTLSGEVEGKNVSLKKEFKFLQTYHDMFSFKDPFTYSGTVDDKELTDEEARALYDSYAAIRHGVNKDTSNMEAIERWDEMAKRKEQEQAA